MQIDISRCCSNSRLRIWARGFIRSNHGCAFPAQGPEPRRRGAHQLSEPRVEGTQSPTQTLDRGWAHAGILRSCMSKRLAVSALGRGSSPAIAVPLAHPCLIVVVAVGLLHFVTPWGETDTISILVYGVEDGDWAAAALNAAVLLICGCLLVPLPYVLLRSIRGRA